MSASDPNPKIIEELWWDVTTTTGLILTLPVPLTSIGNVMTPMSPKYALTHQGAFQASSNITKETYAVNLADARHIRQYTRTHDPERLDRAKLRASGISSPTSSASSLAASSRSAPATNPSGR